MEPPQQSSPVPSPHRRATDFPTLATWRTLLTLREQPRRDAPEPVPWGRSSPHDATQRRRTHPFLANLSRDRRNCPSEQHKFRDLDVKRQSGRPVRETDEGCDRQGDRLARCAILRAVREWPDLVAELAAQRKKVDDLGPALLDIVEAEAGLAGAQAHRTSALDAATAALKARDWPNDATLALETDLEAPAPATQ